MRVKEDCGGGTCLTEASWEPMCVACWDWHIAEDRLFVLMIYTHWLLKNF